MPIFCIHLAPGPGWTPSTTRRDLIDHGRHLHELFVAGRLRMAGPFADGSGLAVVDCPDEAAAWDLARSDPAVRQGLLEPYVRGWEVMFDVASGRSPFHAVHRTDANQ